MYEAFFDFSADPFRLSPDHSFAYTHKGYVKARAYMAYAYMRAEGFVMITGRPGTGKTTLIGALVDQLVNEQVTTANLVCTQLEADDLLKLVAYDFGIDTSVTQKGELLQQLTRRLKAWNRDGRRALLIVDEAQDLSVTAMEELRLLTNIQEGGKPLLQIFLLGQPELRDLILRPELEQVHQRIVAASHLQPLEQEETEAYIRHRLETVGWVGDPAISKPVYPLVYKFSEGVPRRINLICSRLFLHCSVEQRHQIAVSDVREVIGELQSEDLAAGTKISERDFRVPDEFDPDDNGGASDQSAGSKGEGSRDGLDPGSSDSGAGEGDSGNEVGCKADMPRACVGGDPSVSTGFGEVDGESARRTGRGNGGAHYGLVVPLRGVELRRGSRSESSILPLSESDVLPRSPTKTQISNEGENGVVYSESVKSADEGQAVPVTGEQVNLTIVQSDPEVESQVGRNSWVSRLILLLCIAIFAWVSQTVE